MSTDSAALRSFVREYLHAEANRRYAVPQGLEPLFSYGDALGIQRR
jgi:hypothetical protein